MQTVENCLLIRSMWFLVYTTYADHENAVLSEDGWAEVKCNIIQLIENARTKQKVNESLLLAEGKMK